MTKENELLRKIPELVKETTAGKIIWDVECQTTEYNPPEEKPRVTEEDGNEWTVDECYVSYFCEYKGEPFLLISYEMIHSRDDQMKTTNMIFLPPLGNRFFDLHSLMPYAVEADKLLTYQVHTLWLAILEQKKSGSEAVHLSVDKHTLTIED